ncbi:hypothetical protein N9N03_01695 [Chlamydiia bacterium]|nr:hypothetical protein [Chlamydiia bacterium]
MTSQPFRADFPRNRFASDTTSEEVVERKPRTNYYVLPLKKHRLTIQDNGLFDFSLKLHCQPFIFNKRGIYLEVTNDANIKTIHNIALEKVIISTTRRTMTIIPRNKLQYIQILNQNKKVTVTSSGHQLVFDNLTLIASSIDDNNGYSLTNESSPSQKINDLSASFK